MQIPCLQIHLLTQEFLAKIVYWIKISVDTYLSIQMKQSYSTILSINNNAYLARPEYATSIYNVNQ
jgi:hypothetical protein